MSSDIQPYILDELDTVIDQTVADIGLYTKNPGDFTRNRKLNATTTIKVTLNMQGNSLNAELLDAFPNLDERMTASAYEQAKGKLKPEIFEHILKEYNKSMQIYCMILKIARIRIVSYSLNHQQTNVMLPLIC